MADPTLWILLAMVAIALVVAFRRGPGVPLEGLRASGRLLAGVWPELVVGFLLAGLLDVLVPAKTIVEWMGQGPLARNLAVGSAAGLLLPGGPYLFFPVAARLHQEGAAAGPLIALLSAKILVSPIRMFTYEAPIMGWPLTLARNLPALVAPPILGLLGHWLHGALQR